MNNTELVRQLRTASVQCDEMRLRDFGYLMKCAADALEQLEKESRKWELDAHANKLERDNYLKKSQELAAAWCDALGKVRVWISVKERLPEVYESVLVAGQMKYKWEDKYDQFVDVGFRDHNEKGFATFNDWYEGQDEFAITHWMPLPNPPAKGREE